jgi:hypothetical protein
MESEMIQGNPYESELEVKERAGMVRAEVAQARPLVSGRGERRRLRARLAAPKQLRVWWVPAAFAMGTLAGLILRGM